MSIFFAVDLDSFICKRQLFAGKRFHESFAFIFASLYMLSIYIYTHLYRTIPHPGAYLFAVFVGICTVNELFW